MANLKKPITCFEITNITEDMSKTTISKLIFEYKEITTFDSIRDASRYTGVSENVIRRVVSGQNRKTKSEDGKYYVFRKVLDPKTSGTKFDEWDALYKDIMVLGLAGDIDLKDDPNKTVVLRMKGRHFSL